MAINVCTVSGSIKSVSNTAVTTSSVAAYIVTPFFHTDGTYIANYRVSTIVDVNGDWSLDLIETESVEKSIVVRIEYPGGTQDRLIKEYTIVVPDQASATLASLIGTQE